MWRHRAILPYSAGRPGYIRGEGRWRRWFWLIELSRSEATWNILSFLSEQNKTQTNKQNKQIDK